MKKLLDRLNIIARWRARRACVRKRQQTVECALEEESDILTRFLFSRDLPSDRPVDWASLRDAIQRGRRHATVTPRTKDILVTYKVPLPREYWRHWRHTPEARASMTKAQQKRRQKEHDADDFTAVGDPIRQVLAQQRAAKSAEGAE